MDLCYWQKSFRMTASILLGAHERGQNCYSFYRSYGVI
jgi:hypothetical protein